MSDRSYEKRGERADLSAYFFHRGSRSASRSRAVSATASVFALVANASVVDLAVTASVGGSAASASVVETDDSRCRAMTMRTDEQSDRQAQLYEPCAREQPPQRRHAHLAQLWTRWPTAL